MTSLSHPSPAFPSPPLPDIAGALAEPLSVAVRAERRSGGVEGKDVQIIRGGTIGILTALVTKARKPGGKSEPEA